MLKKVLSKFLIVSLLLTMIVPGVAQAAGGSLADDFASKTITNIVKKNIYSEDLLDVCFYPANNSFYAVGNNGTMLVSTDGDTWSVVTDTVITSSSNVNFVDMFCTSDQIAVVGQEQGTGNNFLFLKNGSDAFSKIDLTAVGSGNHKVQAVAISNDTIIVTTNSSSYYSSRDRGLTWTIAVLHADSTGATAIAVNPDNGNFKVYNKANNNQPKTFDYNINTGQWAIGNTDRQMTGEVNNLYKVYRGWLVFISDDNNYNDMGLFEHNTIGGANKYVGSQYVVEAAFTNTNDAIITVGWQRDQFNYDHMIIRTSSESNTLNPITNANMDSTGGSYVGRGKLYGIAGGSISGQMVYIAVGSNGSIFKTTNHNNASTFYPVAQEIDTTAQIKQLVVNEDVNGAPGHQAAITMDNRLYYSIDGGSTWKFVATFTQTQPGEFVGMTFSNFFNTQQLYVLKNNLPGTQDRPADSASVYRYEFPSYKGSNNILDFKAQGVTKHDNTPVYYGTTPSNGQAKIVRHNTNTDVLLASNSTTAPGNIQLTMNASANGSLKFAFIGNKIHVMQLANSSSAYTIAQHNGNGVVYSDMPNTFVAWAEGNERQVLMNASGEVRVFNNPNMNSMSYRDSLIYTGSGVDASGFEVSKLLFVNGIYVVLGKDGSVYTSFNGIEWAHQVSLSSSHIVDLAKSNNKLLLLNKNNTIETVTISYNAYTDNKVVKYPNPTVTRPTNSRIDGTVTGTNIIAFDTTNDPNAVGNTVSYTWFTSDANGTVKTPIAGQTSSSLDLADLTAGVNYIYTEVTYSNPSYVDQPQSTRSYGPFTYIIEIPRYDIDVTYSATSFTAVEGYNSPVTPITVTIENTGDIAISDLQINSSDTSVVTVGQLTSITLAAGETTTTQLNLAPNQVFGSYSADITVSSAAANITKTETINVSITDVPRYELNGDVDRNAIQLAHNYASATDAKVTLSLENTGNRAIEALSVTLSDTQNFELSTIPAIIAIGDTATIEITPKVTLQPGSTYNYQLTINSEAAAITKSVTITVDETPRYDVTLIPVKTDVTISDDYTNVSSGELVVYIENTGNRDLNDLAVELQGADASSFTLNTITPNLAVGQHVSVIATPNASLPINEYNATVTVTAATYSINKSQAVKLTVTDVPVYNVGLSLSTNNLNLAHNYTTADGTITVSVQNTGNRDVTPVVSVSHPTVLEVGIVPTIAANSSASFNIQTLQNVAAGTYPVTLTFTTEAGTITETIHVSISPAPLYDLSVSADRTTATLVQGYTHASDGKFVITAENSGNQLLRRISVAVSDTVNFTVGAVPAELAAGVQESIEITPIAGLAAGTYPITVTFQADSMVDKSITLTLTVQSAQTNPGNNDGTNPGNNDGTNPGSNDGSSPGSDNGITPGGNTGGDTGEQGSPITFNDVQGHWAFSSIARGIQMQIVKGFEDGTFRPDHQLTRGEFAVMLQRALGLEVKDGIEFTDQASIPQWAREAIKAASAAGLIVGYNDGTFRSDGTITRAEIAVIIARVLNVKSEAALAFVDATGIPAWATQEIAAIAELGLISGRSNGNFEPDGNATRAEAIVLILRLLDYQNGK